jgi:hypothetical protein
VNISVELFASEYSVKGGVLQLLLNFNVEYALRKM